MGNQRQCRSMQSPQRPTERQLIVGKLNNQMVKGETQQRCSFDIFKKRSVRRKQHATTKQQNNDRKQGGSSRIGTTQQQGHDNHKTTYRLPTIKQWMD